MLGSSNLSISTTLQKVESSNAIAIAAFHMQGPGNQSICLSGQKFLATIFVMKTQQNTQESRDNPWTDRAEQYASKEDCIRLNK